MRAALLPCAAASLLAALGAGPAAALVPPSVELTRPRAGEELVAGTQAIVEWRHLGTALDPTIEEWEAFLSFDGGAYYAVRITPHLDIARRSFSFQVPVVVTDDARFMLRFGDEVEEVGLEIPHRFSIRLPAFTVLGRGRRIPARGESARPGEPGVVAWVEGSRAGEDLELFESEPMSSAGPVVSGGLSEPTPALLRDTSSPMLLGTAEQVPRPRPPPRSFQLTDVLPPVSVLLLGCRRNE